MCHSHALTFPSMPFIFRKTNEAALFLQMTPSISTGINLVALSLLYWCGIPSLINQTDHIEIPHRVIINKFIFQYSQQQTKPQQFSTGVPRYTIGCCEVALKGATNLWIFLPFDGILKNNHQGCLKVVVYPLRGAAKYFCTKVLEVAHLLYRDIELLVWK